MRRILAGLEVVRPRCAARAPPRPRLRSTAPYTDRNEANKHENDQGSTFTGVPNTDKEMMCIKPRMVHDAAPVCLAHCLPTRRPCVLLCGITALRGGLVFAVGGFLSGLGNL